MSFMSFEDKVYVWTMARKYGQSPVLQSLGSLMNEIIHDVQVILHVMGVC